MSPEPDDPAVPPALFLSHTVEEPDLLLLSFLLLALLLAGAFFTAGETAVLTIETAKFQKMAKEGDRKAAKVLKLKENSSRFLSAVRFSILLVGFLASALAAEVFTGPLSGLLLLLPLSQTAARGLSVVLITLLLCCVFLVFGELAPRKAAAQRAEQVSIRFAGALNAASSVSRPLVFLLTSAADGLLRLFGSDPNDLGQNVTEEKILMMVDAGEEKGVLNEDAKDMISNIFEFSDSCVDEVMTHRTDVSAVEDTDSVQEVIGISMGMGFSRIPVYHEDLDNIVGIIYVKDLLRFVGRDVEPDVRLTGLMRSAYFVPESKPCSQLFSEMTAHRFQIAVVVDEYGGTEGIITMEDLLESIVGNIQDEYDNEAEEISKVDDNRFTVEGTTPMDEVSELTGVELPEGDYDTMAGLMMDTLGRIPKENEHPQVKIKNLTLTVALMEDRRIARILVERTLEPEEESTGK